MKCQKFAKKITTNLHWPTKSTYIINHPNADADVARLGR
jgi:hypothetical protein